MKARQEMRVTTRASKKAEAIIKQIASQKLQAEKSRMYAGIETKKSHTKLQVMKAAQTKSNGSAKNRAFRWNYIERMKGEILEQVEIESKTLENKDEVFGNIQGSFPAQNKYTTSKKKNPSPLPSDPANNRPKKKRKERKKKGGGK